MMKVLAVCLGVGLVGSVMAGPVIWQDPVFAPGPQLLKQTFSQQRIRVAEQVVMQRLIDGGVLGKHGNQYRQVKMRLFLGGEKPFARIALYSNVMMTFRVFQVDLSQDLSRAVGAVIKNPSRVKANHYSAVSAPTPVCPQAGGKATALLFLPEYDSSLDKKGDILMQSMDKIIKSVEDTYQKTGVIVLKAQDASKANFIACMNNNPIEFLMQVGSENNNPDVGRWAGTAFATDDSVYDNAYVTADDILKTSSASTLKAVILSGCRMFSDNVPNGLYPMLTKNLKNLQLYSSGLTQLDIPGAGPTYACFVDQIFNPNNTSDAYNKLQICAKNHDPYIRQEPGGAFVTNSQLYVANHSPDNPKVSEYSLNITNNTKAVFKVPINTIKNITGPLNSICTNYSSGSICDKSIPLCKDSNSIDVIKKMTQGIWTFGTHLPSGGGNRCFGFGNVIDEMTLTAQKTGVQFGLWQKDTGPRPQNNVLKTVFSVKVQPGFSADCKVIPQNLSFKVNGVFQDEPDKLAYPPMTEAAEAAAQGDDGSSVVFSWSAATKDPAPTIGYYQVGKWQFSIEPTSIQHLPLACQLSIEPFGQSAKPGEMMNDVGGTDIHILLRAKAKK